MYAQNNKRTCYQSPIPCTDPDFLRKDLDFLCEAILSIQQQMAMTDADDSSTDLYLTEVYDQLCKDYESKLSKYISFKKNQEQMMIKMFENRDCSNEMHAIEAQMTCMHLHTQTQTNNHNDLPQLIAKKKSLRKYLDHLNSQMSSLYPQLNAVSDLSHLHAHSVYQQMYNEYQSKLIIYNDYKRQILRLQLQCEQQHSAVISGYCIISIDVECAATGKGHFDSAPCRIAAVDYNGNAIFNQNANVTNMVDPLTEFTGLTTQEINDSKDINLVLSELHEMLIYLQNQYEYGVIIIGQSVQNDIAWTKLSKNIHYNGFVDLAEIFKTGNYYYSLRKEAYALLGQNMNDGIDYHDPIEDAKASIQLYREYANNECKLENAKERLIEFAVQRKYPNFQVKCKYQRCEGKYDPKRCVCGQKTARGVKDVDKLAYLFYNKY